MLRPAETRGEMPGQRGRMRVRGARPEGVGEFFGDVGPKGCGGAGGDEIVCVNDERIARGAAFGFVDFLDGGIGAGVGAQAVDGFGGERRRDCPIGEFSKPRQAHLQPMQHS